MENVVKNYNLIKQEIQNLFHVKIIVMFFVTSLLLPRSLLAWVHTSKLLSNCPRKKKQRAWNTSKLIAEPKWPDKSPLCREWWSRQDCFWEQPWHRPKQRAGRHFARWTWVIHSLFSQTKLKALFGGQYLKFAMKQDWKLETIDWAHY